MILSTMPGRMVFGFSEILAVFDSSSAILADFAIRGSAISAVRAAGIAFSDFLGCFFMNLFRIHRVLTAS